MCSINIHQGQEFTKKSSVRKIFVCSPYSTGNVEENVELAKKVARKIVDMGFIPIVPHLFLTTFLDDGNYHDRWNGILIGRELMYDCHEMWVFNYTKESEGMTYELNYWNNKMAGKPVIHKSVEEFLDEFA